MTAISCESKSAEAWTDRRLTKSSSPSMRLYNQITPHVYVLTLLQDITELLGVTYADRVSNRPDHEARKRIAQEDTFVMLIFARHIELRIVVPAGPPSTSEVPEPSHRPMPILEPSCHPSVRVCTGVRDLILLVQHAENSAYRNHGKVAGRQDSAQISIGAMVVNEDITSEGVSLLWDGIRIAGVGLEDIRLSASHLGIHVASV
jgi:hypothetical protein